jgi:hypothetical protein
MLTIGKAGQIFPPPLVGGKTPEELKLWLRDVLGAGLCAALEEDFGEVAVLDVAIAWFSHSRLLALLDGAESPRGDDERELVEAAAGGRPISLLAAGLEDWEGEGFSPILRRVDGGWVFGFGEFTSGPFAGAGRAAQACREYVDARTV